jgi:hypothetical protein
MPIDSETLEEFAPPAIVAHCLWDMTFHGFTQEKIEAFELELEQECDRLDAMTDEEETGAGCRPAPRRSGARVAVRDFTQRSGGGCAERHGRSRGLHPTDLPLAVH